MKGKVTSLEVRTLYQTVDKHQANLGVNKDEITWAAKLHTKPWIRLGQIPESGRIEHGGEIARSPDLTPVTSFGDVVVLQSR